MSFPFQKVALLMGGTSSERAISLHSAHAVQQALLRNHIQVTAFDTAEPYLIPLLEGKFEAVFIALHGRGGEDGSLQGLLESLKLPYTGTGVLGSALAMDKYRTKLLWQAAHLPTPPSYLTKSIEQLQTLAPQLTYPVAVKPTAEGSSVGISKVAHPQQLLSAWKLAAAYGPVLIEQWIQGPEYTVALLDAEALPVIKLETPRGFYDYQAKYQDPQTRYYCPCGLPKKEEQALQELALQAFQLLPGRSWGRIDLICDPHGQPWLLEANTVPGMTDHSLVPRAAQAAGLNFDQLVLRILTSAQTNLSY